MADYIGTATGQQIDALPGKVSQLEQNLGELDDNKLEVDSVKSNGNIVLKDGDGNKKEYMAATPSGDPLHYLYINRGAEWNDTDATIVKTDMFGNTINHLSKHWYLGGIGDIDNDEIRDIYNRTAFIRVWDGLQCDRYNFVHELRTNFVPFCDSYVVPRSVRFQGSVLFHYSTKTETINMQFIDSSNDNLRWKPYFLTSAFDNCSTLRTIYAYIDMSYILNQNNASLAFNCCYKLIDVRLYQLKVNISLEWSPKLSKDSLLYMINNSAATSAITITLHADVYAKCIEGGVWYDEVSTALASKTYVSLVSA